MSSMFKNVDTVVEECPAAEIVVRHTFISIVAPEEKPQHRSSSLPPSLRLAQGVASDQGSRKGSRKQSRKEICPVDTTSTADASTDLSVSEGDYTSVDLDQASVCCMSPEQECAVPQAMLLTGVMLGHFFCPTGPMQPGAGAEPLLGPFVPMPAATPLNPNAREWAPSVAGVPQSGQSGPSRETKAWAPSAGPPTKPPSELPEAHREQFSSLALQVTEALERHPTVLQVEAEEGQQGYCVTAYVQPQDLCNKEQLLSVAKAALLRGAERSESAYVVGYGWKPFAPTPLGFSAMLAAVEDQNKACWGHLKLGCCRHGGQCRWQHPREQAIFSVKVKLAEP